MTKGLHVCRFDAVSDLRGRHRTYENIRAAVLKAGRFSVFDVETVRDARLFDRLRSDPTLAVGGDEHAYPWTGVRLKSQAKE